MIPSRLRCASVLLVVLVAVALVGFGSARADNCFYALDNVDSSFVKFDLQQGSVNMLGSLPDNSQYRVSAAFNPTRSVYYIVSQPASDTDTGPKSLFTVDVKSGNVLHKVQFGDGVDMPSNLVWDDASGKLYGTYVYSQQPHAAFVAVINPDTGSVTPVNPSGGDLLHYPNCNLTYLNHATYDSARGLFYVPVECNATFSGTSSYIAVQSVRGGSGSKPVLWHIADAPIAIKSALLLDPSSGALLLELMNVSSFDQTLVRVAPCADHGSACITTIGPLGALAYAWYVDWKASPPVYLRGTQVPFTHPERFEAYTLPDGKGPKYYSLNSFGLVFSIAPTAC